MSTVTAGSSFNPACGFRRDLRTYGGLRPSGWSRGHSYATHNLRFELGSLIKKRRKKMSKHKYRKRQKANRHKKK